MEEVTLYREDNGDLIKVKNQTAKIENKNFKFFEDLELPFDCITYNNATYLVYKIEKNENFTMVTVR